MLIFNKSVFAGSPKHFCGILEPSVAHESNHLPSPVVEHIAFSGGG